MLLQYFKWVKAPVLKLFLIGSLAVVSQNALAFVDEDNDGVDDSIDNCKGVYNPLQTDTDLSYWGVIKETVIDGVTKDIVMDTGAYPANPASSKGDDCDDDDDGDGVPDLNEDGSTLDFYPLDPYYWEENSTPDADNDGIGDLLDPSDDGDSIDDVIDNCPLVANEDQANSDAYDQDGQPTGDKAGDACDLFPNDSSEWANTDGDTVIRIVIHIDKDTGEEIIEEITEPLGNNEDKDDDNDGILDTEDNCRLIENSNQADTDGDSVGDACDAFPSTAREQKDSDGDGWGDRIDNCPLIPNPSRANNNGIRAGDACDINDDSDPRHDLDDRFPYDSSEWEDSDNDGVGDNSDAFPFDNSEQKDSDRDGFGDNTDALPFNANEWLNTDGDTIIRVDEETGEETIEQLGNNEDTDDDNDDVEDAKDPYPLDKNKWSDKDLDGFSDQGLPDDTTVDQFPSDPFEWIDSDGDGIGDNGDAFPNDPDEHSDIDGDGIGDNSDADGFSNDNDDFPYDSSETRDKDGDGVGDRGDDYPDDPTRTYDTDGDGTADTLIDPDTGAVTNLDTDDDNDGIPDYKVGTLDPEDNCRLVANENQTDTDGDGQGDACDNDDDNDGTDDARDPFPLDDNEVLDSDGDGVGNRADLDDDDDSVADVDDRFPLDPNEYVDTDGDGVGDNADRFRFNASEQYDLDNDNKGDWADTDDDGDSINEEFDPGGAAYEGLDPNAPKDNCPRVFNPGQTDTDGDMQGDACDNDDDNDTVEDALDAFPLDASETKDTDGDGMGDNSDQYPTDPKETTNSDGDHMGNNSDPDDDNDGIPDSIEDALYAEYEAECLAAEKKVKTAADAVTANATAQALEGDPESQEAIDAAAAAATAQAAADTAAADAPDATIANSCIYPLIDDSGNDFDEDGTSNIDEYHNGTLLDDSNHNSTSVKLQHYKFITSDGATHDSFGTSIVQHGNIAAVGAPNAIENGISTGAVYLFNKTDGANEWTQDLKLMPSQSNPDQHFGSSIAIGENIVVVGATGDDENGPNTGAIYIFTRTGDAWTQQKVTPFDGGTDFYFGSSIVLTNNAIFVGSPGYSETGK
ncbi:thrombospondin type 3 repeat-containing protein, partial [Pseudomonadota bacterium]